MYAGNIGKKIVICREKKGLSQKNLANLIPISQSTLSRWEKGVAVPSIQHLNRICDVLEVPIENILSEDKRNTGKVRKKTIWLKILAVALVIVFVICAYSLVPKFRVVSEEKHDGDYGRTLTLYVKPILLLTESRADSYGRKLAEKKRTEQEVDCVEVIYIKGISNQTDKEDENIFFTNIYFIPTFSE